jgi:phospholipid/cholesterol/gamma-HCH transport system permease protein
MTGAPSMNTPATPLIRHAVEDGADVVYLQGTWRLSNLPAISAAVDALRLDVKHVCVLDGRHLQELDTSAGFMLFSHLGDLGFVESGVRTRAMAEGHVRLLDLVHERMRVAPVAAPSVHCSVVQRIGLAVAQVWRVLRTHSAFVGEVALEMLALVRRPRLFRFKESVSQFESVVLDAVPIAALVTFLIGVVFAYLLGVQARRYGATIFVVDGVGLAMCRELSPILVAIIVAGRSGAAFTAQIGSMKVQEETDAIRTLGLSPIQVLVLPRLVAIVFGLPLLVFVGDVAGIAGGMLISASRLDISPSAFMHRLHATLDLSAFVIGIGKAPFFAAFIAMIACRMGLTVARDARSVGEHTTSTVVQCIVWVIVLDAVFAVGLQRLGY